MVDFVKHFGYVPNPEATAAYVETLPFASISRDLPHLMATNADKRDVLLTLDIIATDPNWRREAQETNDCTSWGWTHAGNCLYSGQVRRGESEFCGAWFFQPAMYGWSIVEIGHDHGDNGWYGAGCSKAALLGGMVPSLDWSKETGNPNHNCTQYSGRIATDWSNNGCGGKNDGGKLDAIGGLHPFKESTLARLLNEAEAVIDRWCPIPICSDYGFEGMQRDLDGVVRRRGSWSHCMCCDGKAYLTPTRRVWHIMQSWGDCASGPDPLTERLARAYFTDSSQADAAIEKIGASSWWIDDDDMAGILGQEDSFGVSGVAGFANTLWDWDHGVLV